MNTLSEGTYGHGAKKSPIHRKLWRKLKHPVAKMGLPFDWSKGFSTQKPTVRNQGTSSSCGGQAGAGLIEAKTGAVVSAKSIYSPMHAPRGGMAFDALITQVCAHGANLESTVPSYDISGNPLSEGMMEDESWQTPRILADAITRAGYTPIRINPDIESVAQAIRDYTGVIWMIAGQNNGTWLSTYPLPPQKGGAPLWYHYMVCIGASAPANVKQIDAQNSWGSSVGDNGVQHFRQDYFDAKGIIECYAFLSDRLIVPIPSPNLTPTQALWQSVCQWFRSSWGLASKSN